MLDTYGIVVIAFFVTNKTNRVRFFKETFLVANISLEVVLGLLFLTLNSADIDLLRRELWWRTYTTQKALPIIRCNKLVRKKEFAAIAPDSKHEILVVQIASLTSSAGMHPFHRLQIAGLIAKEAPTKISTKYKDFADLFSPDLMSKLSEHTEINNHAIELKNANRFIKPSKSPAIASIFFDWKSDRYLCLYANYRGLNNLIIKNRYPIPG